MTEQDLQRLDDEVRAAILRSDVTALARLFADDFVGTNPFNRVVTRQHVLDAVQSGRIKHSRFERQIEQMRVWGDTAVIVGRETVVDGEGPVIQRRYTDTWHRQGADWRLAVRHASIVTPEASS